MELAGRGHLSDFNANEVLPCSVVSQGDTIEPNQIEKVAHTQADLSGLNPTNINASSMRYIRHRQARPKSCLLQKSTLLFTEPPLIPQLQLPILKSHTYRQSYYM